MRSAPLSYERELWKKGHVLVAGIDEVGCGCWAGNVFAAAVVLSPLHLPQAQDSKRLSAALRTRLAENIKKKSVAWAIGQASVSEIDALNIRQAAFLAMRRALEGLPTSVPTWVLCDGFVLPNITMPCTRLVGGDHRSRSIAAASILAKVARDQEMERYEQEYPGYGFAKHKGYGTKVHALALKTQGLSPLHRLSFKPIQTILTRTASAADVAVHNRAITQPRPPKTSDHGDDDGDDKAHAPRRNPKAGSEDESGDTGS
jgi:ribonuclease HII